MRIGNLLTNTESKLILGRVRQIGETMISIESFRYPGLIVPFKKEVHPPYKLVKLSPEGYGWAGDEMETK